MWEVILGFIACGVGAVAMAASAEEPDQLDASGEVPEKLIRAAVERAYKLAVHLRGRQNAHDLVQDTLEKVFGTRKWNPALNPKFTNYILYVMRHVFLDQLDKESTAKGQDTRAYFDGLDVQEAKSRNADELVDAKAEVLRERERALRSRAMVEDELRDRPLALAVYRIDNDETRPFEPTASEVAALLTTAEREIKAPQISEERKRIKYFEEKVFKRLNHHGPKGGA